MGGHGRGIVIGNRRVPEPDEGKVHEVYRYADDTPPPICRTCWGRSLMTQLRFLPSPSGLNLHARTFSFPLDLSVRSPYIHVRSHPSRCMLTIIICTFLIFRSSMTLPSPHTLIVYSLCVIPPVLSLHPSWIFRPGRYSWFDRSGFWIPGDHL